jgi:DNA processing protein
MNSIRELTFDEYPPLLKEIHSPPKALYIRGGLPGNEYTFLTIVGSRRYSDYGKEAVEMLIESLKGLPVVIVSGLAFGIDAIAHRAAIKHGLKTIAIPGSGLSSQIIYPASNKKLAFEILEHGGALISPFEESVQAAPWMFPVRNRIMAGISHATLVVEAEIKSGTLITSKHATDFNRDVFAIPGSIFSNQSAGPHMLIRLGATPITCGNDLIEALGFSVDQKRAALDYSKLSPEEMRVIEALETPLSRDLLHEKLGMETSLLNSLISLLEIKEFIYESCGELYKK